MHQSACLKHLPFMLLLTAGVFAAPVTPACAQEPAGADLSELSLEDLMKITVTSVSRKEQPLQRSPAAVYVIQGEEVRRLGIRTLGEALRLSPGLDVAALNAQDYAINARGLSNGSSSNKLEVLVDGRSIYTPLFSGVLWDQQIAFIEDLDRIEVIRGPAGAVWGANAVNGVINIVTKTAAQSGGAALIGGLGTEMRGYGGARYGFSLGEATHARLYALGYRLDRSATPGGNATRDGYTPRQGGFRSDSVLGEAGSLTLQGDAFNADAEDGPVNTALSGWNFISTWRSAESADGQWVAHGYLDHYRRDTPAVFGETRNTANLELQRRWIASDSHDLIGGVSYRRTADDTASDRSFTLDPPSRTLQTWGALVQDDITLQPQRWNLTLGTKYERNGLTGSEWQPSARSAYTFDGERTLWAAVSRAVRVPTRLDRDGVATVPGEGAAGVIADPGGTTPPEDPTGSGNSGLFQSIFGALFGSGSQAATRQRFGNPDFQSEELLAYELGYRAAITPGWSLDSTAFYNDYDKLQSVESNGEEGNGIRGRTSGLELLMVFQASADLQLHLDWTYLRTRLSVRPESTDTATPAKVGNDPRGYGGIRLRYAPSAATAFEAYLRHVDSRPNLGVHAYQELNLAWSWAPRPWWLLRLAGHNLLHPQHAEGSDTEIERATELQMELRWN